MPMIGDPSTSAATGEDATLLATASRSCLIPGLAVPMEALHPASMGSSTGKFGSGATFELGPFLLP